jgi:subtilase family serine protease
VRLQRLFLLLLSGGALLLASRVPATQAQGNPATLPSVVPVCPGPAQPGTALCHSLRRTDINGIKPNVTAPSGYGPSQLRSAYNLTTSSTGTVAIVDAFDDPNAESDLQVYRSTLLPAGTPACTTASGCFTKVNQSGGTKYPRSNIGWAEEISLDLDMVSAICPTCHILLVEASSNSFANLAAAVNYAAGVPGVVAISNSYGASEFSSEATPTYDGPYNHPGIAVTASSGDGGYGVEFPAASQYVTAVGGTTLNTALVTTSNTRGWAETVWSGAGSGCSAYITKPSWQTDPGCTNRTVADVAADADPNTGVAVYDSFHESGWLEFGGTSVASPIIASVYALAGNAVAATTPTPATTTTPAYGGYGAYSYGQTSSLNDVTSGSNGSCGGSYLCTGGTGYDGPTGLGTPNGTGGF